MNLQEGFEGWEDNISDVVLDYMKGVKTGHHPGLARVLDSTYSSVSFSDSVSRPTRFCTYPPVLPAFLVWIHLTSQLKSPPSARVRIATPLIEGRELEYVADAVRRGEISSIGGYIPLFEKAFADFCEVPIALSCSNGTVGLHLALLGLGVGAGDEVIVPALTFVSTANAVVHAGATPVFADVHPGHWGLDPAAVAAQITPRTKAIIVVHLYGHPADLDPLLSLAEQHGLFLIEDAAEAHGARYRGKRVGSIGDVGVFSFYGNKIMTTGEGGMVTTSRPDLAARMQQYKNHGADPERRYWHPIVGYNYRLTNLQAAVGLAQVERAEDLLAAKRRIASVYCDQLKGLPLSLQSVQAWAEPVYWMNCVVLNETAPVSSEQLRRELGARGVETRPFFPSVPTFPPYVSPNAFPVTERLSRDGLNLPSGPKLSLEEIHYVTDTVRQLLSG